VRSDGAAATAVALLLVVLLGSKGERCRYAGSTL
jgi:hypothetical protein